VRSTVVPCLQSGPGSFPGCARTKRLSLRARSSFSNLRIHRVLNGFLRGRLARSLASMLWCFTVAKPLSFRCQTQLQLILMASSEAFAVGTFAGTKEELSRADRITGIIFLTFLVSIWPPVSIILAIRELRGSRVARKMASIWRRCSIRLPVWPGTPGCFCRKRRISCGRRCERNTKLAVGNGIPAPSSAGSTVTFLHRNPVLRAVFIRFHQVSVENLPSPQNGGRTEGFDLLPV